MLCLGDGRPVWVYLCIAWWVNWCQVSGTVAGCGMWLAQNIVTEVWCSVGSGCSRNGRVWLIDSLSITSLQLLSSSFVVVSDFNYLSLVVIVSLLPLLSKAWFTIFLLALQSEVCVNACCNARIETNSFPALLSMHLTSKSFYIHFWSQRDASKNIVNQA